ncbi:alpha/beta hydrolase [Mycoplasmatota bacterium WC44]
MKTINLKINNKNIRVTTWGKPSNEPIVFFHGLGGTSLSCIEIAEKLDRNYYIVSLDLPGHGKTEQFDTEEEFEIQNIIPWINRIVSQLVNGKHHIIAHSWGADLALHYMNQFPDDINKIVLLDGGYHDKETSNKYFTEYNENNLDNQISSMEEEIEYYLNDFDNYIFESLDEAVDTELRNYDRKSKLLEIATNDLIKCEDGKFKWHATGQTAKFAVMSMYKNPTRNVYHMINDNVLLLHCSLSVKGYMTDYRKLLIDKIKNNSSIKTVMIENSGHMVHWDNPQEVTKEILNFIV